MKPTTMVALLAIFAAAMGSSALAHASKQDSQQNRQYLTDKRNKDRFDHGMQEVRHSATPDTPGKGWRYFTDPEARRAVVISPQGDYYYSRGKGLQWIAAEQF